MVEERQFASGTVTLSTVEPSLNAGIEASTPQNNAEQDHVFINKGGEPNIMELSDDECPDKEINEIVSSQSRAVHDDVDLANLPEQTSAQEQSNQNNVQVRIEQEETTAVIAIPKDHEWIGTPLPQQQDFLDQMGHGLAADLSQQKDVNPYSIVGNSQLDKVKRKTFSKFTIPDPWHKTNKNTNSSTMDLKKMQEQIQNFNKKIAEKRNFDTSQNLEEEIAARGRVRSDEQIILQQNVIGKLELPQDDQIKGIGKSDKKIWDSYVTDSKEMKQFLSGKLKSDRSNQSHSKPTNRDPIVNDSMKTQISAIIETSQSVMAATKQTDQEQFSQISQGQQNLKPQKISEQAILAVQPPSPEIISGQNDNITRREVEMVEVGETALVAQVSTHAQRQKATRASNTSTNQPTDDQQQQRPSKTNSLVNSPQQRQIIIEESPYDNCQSQVASLVNTPALPALNPSISLTVPSRSNSNSYTSTPANNSDKSRANSRNNRRSSTKSTKKKKTQKSELKHHLIQSRSVGINQLKAETKSLFKTKQNTRNKPAEIDSQQDTTMIDHSQETIAQNLEESPQLKRDSKSIQVAPAILLHRSSTIIESQESQQLIQALNESSDSSLEILQHMPQRGNLDKQMTQLINTKNKSQFEFKLPHQNSIISAKPKIKVARRRQVDTQSMIQNMKTIKSQPSLLSSISDSGTDNDEVYSSFQQNSRQLDDSSDSLVMSDEDLDIMWLDPSQSPSLRPPKKLEVQPFKKFSMSKVEKLFTQITLQERLQHMSQKVTDLFKSDKDYYQGKQVRFENNSSYYQCLVQSESEFILVQSVNRSCQFDNHEQYAQTSEQHLQIPTFGDDQQLFNFNSANDSQSIIQYETAELKTQNKSDLQKNKDNKSALTIISFWRKDQDRQFQCSQPISEFNVIKRITNKEMNFQQALFGGQQNSKEIFFFSQSEDYYNGAVILNILEGESQTHNAATGNSPRHSKRQVTGKQQIKRFIVNKDSILSEQLLYQTQEHKIKAKIRFGVPDPVMVKLDEVYYLIMTILNEDKTAVCFFQIEDIKKRNSIQDFVDSIQEELIKPMTGEPAFKISGAEMFISKDQDDNILFLTNKRNLNNEVVANQEFDYQRLISQSVIKKITLQQLKELRSLQEEDMDDSEDSQSQKSMERVKIFDSMPTLSLQAGAQSMNFFRTQSNLYPYIQTAYDEKMNSLTLLFHGSEKIASSAVHFEISSKESNSDSLPKKNASILKGLYVNAEDEEVIIKLQVKGKDATCDDISLESSGNEKKSGRSFRVEQEIKKQEWVIEKWFQAKNNQRSPFSITNLEFDSQSGQIIGGQGNLEGVSQQLNLKPAAVQEEVNASDMFYEEKYFKLEFVSNDPQIRAQIEGSYVNKPFNTYLVGHFTRITSQKNDSKTNTQICSSFTIYRRTLSKLYFDDDKIVNEFDVEITGGQVSNHSNQIQLLSEFKANYLFEDVHQIVQSQNSLGVFLLHGSLSKLIAKGNRGNQRRDQDQNGGVDSKLKITQFFLEQKKKTSQILRKDFAIPNEKVVKQILGEERLKNQNSLLQGLAVSKNLQITFSVLSSLERGDNSTIEFVQDELKSDQQSSKENLEKDLQYQAQGPTTQTWICDYPLIAYKSYFPDNSQIVVTNLAEKENYQQILNLGQWEFLCFVQSVSLCKHFKDDINPFHCQILFLAQHKTIKKVRLMLIEQDPWNPNKLLKIKVISTCEIKLPPFPTEKIKSVNLLTKRQQEQEQTIMALVFQYSDSMWSVSLNQVDRVVSLFDATARKAAARYAMRRINDTAHIYCITNTSSKSEIVKIGIDDEDQQDKIIVYPKLESLSSKFLIIEPDLENPNYIFVINDEQRVIKIFDDGEGKATIVTSVDMSHHDLQDELLIVQKNPWTGLTISDSMVSFEDYYFSLRTKFFWKDEINYQKDRLVYKHVLRGTLQIAQLWHLQNGQRVIRIKPMPSSNLVDILGQSRTNEQTKMYFATEDKVLMQIEHNEKTQILVFDSRGYYLQQLPIDARSSPQIVNESLMTLKFGKFFIIKNKKNQITLVQSNSNVFKRITSLSEEEVLTKIRSISFDQLVERFSDKNNEVDAEKYKETLFWHENRTQITKDGYMIFVASVVIDEIDPKLTIFENENLESSSGTGQDEHHEYKFNKKLFGLFQFQKIKVVIFPCKSQQEQNDFKKTTRTVEKWQNTAIVNEDDYELEDKANNMKSQRTFKQRSTTDTSKYYIIHGNVDKKLIWLNFESKLIQHFDLDKYLVEDNKTSESENINWTEVSVSGFTVREVLSNFTHEHLKTKGIYIDEIGEESMLRKKQTDQRHENNPCLMQLTTGDNATVYDLQADNKYEVSLLRSIYHFQNPIIFSTTGFEYKTTERILKCNTSQNLGLVRPFPINSSRGLYRTHSEMDYNQIASMLMLCKQKPHYTKSDVNDIEIESLFSMFNNETFFSIFAEHSIIYDLAHDLIKTVKQDLQRHDNTQLSNKLSEFTRALNYILEKPTSVLVREKQNDTGNKIGEKIPNLEIQQPTELSIIQQSILSKDSLVSLTAYRISELLDMSLTVYISCIEDIQLIMESLPAQQFRKILNSMEQNIYTIKKKEAIMSKRGEKALLNTFVQNSAVISDHTPQLNMHNLTKNDVKRSVQIKILPLQWITSEGGSQASLFKFFRDNQDILQGSLLLDSIFNAFWDRQRNAILKYVFYPYLFYFSVMIFYYLECLLIQLGRRVGFVSEFCLLFVKDDGPEICEVSESFEPTIRALVFLVLIHQVIIEVFQAKKDGFKEYISQRTNKLDIASLLFNILVPSLVWMGVDILKIRAIASIGIVLLWIQMFFWFRLFDSLAQYVELILQTAYDIKYFMYVMLTLMLMFGSGIYMLQLNRLQEPVGDKEPIFPYDEQISPLVFESLFNQYKILLGDFENMVFQQNSDDFKNPAWIVLENVLITLYFVCSTFFTQIIILNMLIAIMSSTFDHHNQDLHQNAKKQKLVLQAENAELVDFYIELLSRCHKKKKNSEQSPGYLVVIIPTHTNEDDREDSNDNASDDPLIHVLEDKFQNLESYINKKIVKGISDMQQDTMQRLEGMDIGFQDRIDGLKKEMNLKFSKIKDEIKDQSNKMGQELKTEMQEKHESSQKALSSTFKGAQLIDKDYMKYKKYNR